MQFSEYDKIQIKEIAREGSGSGGCVAIFVAIALGIALPMYLIKTEQRIQRLERLERQVFPTNNVPPPPTPTEPRSE